MGSKKGNEKIIGEKIKGDKNEIMKNMLRLILTKTPKESHTSVFYRNSK